MARHRRFKLNHDLIKQGDVVTESHSSLTVTKSSPMYEVGMHLSPDDYVTFYIPAEAVEDNSVLFTEVEPGEEKVGEEE